MPASTSVTAIIGNGSRPTTLQSLSRFAQVANAVSRAAGRPATFALCCLTIVIWAAVGPIFHYSDTWQLIINTGTTIVTFLMVFLIQNTQNRDAMALQAKLDELVRATQGASNKLVDAERLANPNWNSLDRKPLRRLRKRSEQRPHGSCRLPSFDEVRP